MPPREQGTGDPHLDMGLDPEKGVKESQNYDPESSELQHSEANPSEERQRMISVDMVYDKNRRTYRFIKSRKPRNTFQRGKYVFLVAKVISEQGVFRGEYHVEIRRRLLCNNLSNIWGKYAGMSLGGAVVVMGNEKLKLLYHSLPQLQEIQRDIHKPADVRFEVSAAVEFVRSHFTSEIDELSLLPHGRITFALVWTIFKPGAFVYGMDPLGEDRVFRLRFSKYGEESDGSPFFGLTVEYVDYDGYSVGFVDRVSLKIRGFNGFLQIIQLPYFPLDHLPDGGKKCEDLINRANKLLLIKSESKKLQEYKGHSLDEEGETFNNHGRVIIDPFSYRTLRGSASRRPSHPNAHPMSLILSVSRPLQHDVLTDEQKLLFNSVAYGFSLGDKIWGSFAISKLSDVAWDETVFNSLVLSQERKNFLRAMVKTYQPDMNLKFDDIVRDKGKGLIGLLSGSPGVGKTLTAEAIAEISHRPLYVLSSGELGEVPKQVQERLDQVLELTEAWKAKLLLDEADVFLVKRDNENLTRNAITSIFLRKLEYYQGILLLTTNRGHSVDHAFRSRIHFVFEYEPLPFDAREAIWSTFLNRAKTAGQAELKVSLEEKKKLARMQLNGREIKNIVSISQVYAIERKVPITVGEIRGAIDFSIGPAIEDASSDSKLNVKKCLASFSILVLLAAFAWTLLYVRTFYARITHV